MPVQKKRSRKQQDQVAVLLVCVFLIVTVCAGAAAFLFQKNSEKTETPIVEEDLPEEPTDDAQGETDEPSSDDPEQDPSEEESEEPVVFNKPDRMLGVVVEPRKDFLSDSSAEEAAQQAEIDKMLDQIQNYKMNTLIVPLITEDGTVFSVDSAQSISTFDALDYILSSAQGRGLFVYGLYDLSLYGEGSQISTASVKNTENLNNAQAAFTDFIKKYDLDGILLDGCTNIEQVGSYEDYMAYGAGRSYEEYLRDNSEMMVVSTRQLVQKYSRNTQVGLLTDAIWATKLHEESGVDIKSENLGYQMTHLDSKALITDHQVDFIAVKNYTATGDAKEPFEAIAKWWDALAEESGLPIYMVHGADRACTTEFSPGWASHDQLTRQMIALENCKNLQGSAYNTLQALLANPKDSTTLLMNYFSNNVKKEHILKELAFSKPTQLKIATTDKTYTFQGASDPNSPVMVGGERLDTDENGFFSYTVNLEPGENKYTFTHKEKTMTFTITRQVQVLKEVTPTGSITVDGGMKVSITATAYENSSVIASINGQNIPLSLDETGGDEELRGTSYRRYTGSFVAPKGTKTAQNLGNIVVTASWEGITKTMEGASVTVNKLAVVEDGVLVRVTADQAIVFPVDQLGKYPTANCYRLPRGTLDYAVGEEVVYKDGNDVRKYYKLASGMRVYSSDITAVSDNNLVVAGNVISGLTVKADKQFTYVILKSELPVPFDPTYTSTKFQIDFKYTTAVPQNLTLSKNPLFSSAAWNGSTLTLELKTQNGFLGYKAYHEDGMIVFRFNNPTTISGARIVVDPGHGGSDNGAPGFNPNFQEKDVNWAVAKKFARELERRGANVLLLETINQTTSMDVRLAKANDFNAQVFISVHHNSAAPSATGTEAFYFYPFAQSLATKMTASTSSALNTNNRGSKFDVYYVTRDPQFVGILSEGGFITNRKEYNKLIDDDYQQEVASAMADAVASFLKGAGSANAGITGTESTGDEVTSVPDAPSSGGNEGSKDPPKEPQNPDKTSAIKKIVFKDSKITLHVDEVYQMQYKIEPSDASEESLVWDSSDPSVVKVNNQGKLRADKAGTATITLSGGKSEAKCTVRVVDGQAPAEVPVKGVKIVDPPTKMKVGGRVRLTAAVEPNNATNQNVVWELAASSEDMASLSENGALEVYEKGEISLRVRTEDGDYTDTITITVS